MTDFFSVLMAGLADNPWLQGVVAALATFVLEDPTTIGAGLLVLFQRKAGSRRPAAHTGSPIVSSFEFWPPWLFYIPVALKWLQLAVRHRGLLLPTSANPSIEGGGFIGESKSEILDLVPSGQRSWVARWITVVGGQDPGVVQTAMQEAGFDFPVVAKPDIGQRGAGVQPIHGLHDLRAYTEAFPQDVPFVVQEFAGGGSLSGLPEDHPSGFGDVQEAGVMWWRKPGEDQGLISSMTLKVFPALTGDGHRTLGKLIEADQRAGHLAGVYKNRHRADLGRVLDSGEIFPLVFAGNHCQGAVFRDGTALVTPELEARIEMIARSIPEFWFGRFDIRFNDFGRFLKGEDFKIIEINGASAEATHIWDASITLREAYRVLFEQFDVLFSIGAANRRRGFEPLSLGRFFGDLLAYRKVAKGYPETR
ncbi:MAG: D-alanine--D-alanine ligase [Acidobacteriota bacterium]